MKKKRLPSALGVALVLLCLVLVTAHFTTGMYARFTTKTGGGDTGRIASFNVSATSQASTVDITPETGKAGTYALTLSNPGKTAVRYDVKVCDAKIRSDNGSESEIPVVIKIIKNDSEEILENGSGEIAPGGIESVVVAFNMNGYSGAGTVPFTVVVTFTQVD